MNIHEYQAKELFALYGIACQFGKIATTHEEILIALADFPDDGEIVIKAQIHAGGRGKGHFDTGFQGGVKLCKT